MEFEWDEAKRLANLAKHRLDFADLDEFDWNRPLVYPDTRRDYGEARFMALAEFRGRIHSVTFTLRAGTLRAISFRRAHHKEVLRYEKKEE